MGLPDGRMTRRIASVALAAALGPLSALADHPGARWSVNHVQVSIAPEAGDAAELTARVRQGLRQANETYFYGNQAVRMDVRVLSADAMAVTVRDQMTGAVLGRTGPIRLDGSIEEINRTALAWMDGLECTNPGCSGADGPVVAAIEAPVDTRRQTPAAVVIVAKSVAVPVPLPRPGGEAQVRVARNPDLLLRDYPEPLRLARFDAVGMPDLTYNVTDPVVISPPRSLAPTATNPIVEPAVPAGAEDSTMIGRFFASIASFFGFEDEPQAAAVPSATPAAATVASVPLTRASLTNPAAPVRQAPAAPPPSFGVPQATLPAPATETRVAALNTTPDLLPTTIYEPLGNGIYRMPSPGLGLPLPEAELAETAPVAPIRYERAPTSNVPLSVRLDASALATPTSGTTEQLYTTYGNPDSRVRLVATDEAGRRSVDGVLASRGLSLDKGRFAEGLRVYWAGDSGSRGFWINLPRGIPSRYVLIASASSSVVANVHAQGRSVQVSDAVAAALGMAPGGWSDVQVIALREGTRTAARPVRR